MTKEQTNSLKQKCIKTRGEAKWEISMTDLIMRIDIDQIVEIEESNLVVEFSIDKNYLGRPRYGQSYRNEFRRGNFRGNVRMYQNQNFKRQNNRGGYSGNHRNKIKKEIGVGLEKGHIWVLLEGMTEVIVTVGQGQDQGWVLIEI